MGWYYQDEEEGEVYARDFYDQLKQDISHFPLSGYTEIGLVHASADEHWAVAIIAVDGTINDDSVEKAQRLHQWFDKAGAKGQGADSRISRIKAKSLEEALNAAHGGIYKIVESFRR
jgi:hypothetical protein